MRLLPCLLIFCCAIVVSTAFVAVGQTTTGGSDLPLRSGGTASGSDVTLTDNGYVGTYITLTNPGAVTLTVDAAGLSDAGCRTLISLWPTTRRASTSHRASKLFQHGEFAGRHLFRSHRIHQRPAHHAESAAPGTQPAGERRHGGEFGHRSMCWLRRTRISTIFAAVRPR